ncbi:MAG TPA: DedA family protein [Acetobacteraceae bacterium]|nr:DedA family protein [Acetobacteraceae bacterium]
MALVVGLESMGIPLPGETLLVGAALYAAATHRLDIALLVLAATAGAVIGDNLGYLVGRAVGVPLLERYGNKVGLTERRLRLGQYLFRHHGGKVVFFGRFVSVLRTLAALLAGANRMHWLSFLVFNFLGGVIWASCYGFGAYLLGKEIIRLERPLAIAASVIAVVTIVVAFYLFRRNEARIHEAVEREMTRP